MLRKTKDVDQEIGYKQAFRVFYKDSSGCVPAEELKYVLSNLMVRKADGQLIRKESLSQHFCLVFISILIIKTQSALFQISEEEIEEMILKVDKNGDGKIRKGSKNQKYVLMSM